MNKIKTISQKIIFTTLILILSLSANAKRIAILKEKCFNYTKNNITTTITIKYISNTNFYGEITSANANDDDAKTVGISGVEAKGKLNQTYNDVPNTLLKNVNFSKQSWKIITNKAGKETLIVTYYSKGKTTKYTKVIYTSCN